jgi:putative intracellular protease/amidase
MKLVSILGSMALTIGLFTPSAQSRQSKGKIMVVLSSQTSLPLKENKSFSTGYYLNELVVPVQRFADAGYELVFTNPKGNTPAVDVLSEDPTYFGGSEEALEEAKRYADNLQGLAHPLSLKQVAKSDLNRYVAVFVPGGPAPMIDLMADPDLARILRFFHNHRKTTILLCHGPVALLAATKNPVAYQQALRTGDVARAETLATNWPYKGYKIAMFSDDEESQAAKNVFHADPLFTPEDALRTAGAQPSVVTAWHSNAIQDRELITGQNPFSDAAMTEIVLRTLAEHQ